MSITVIFERAQSFHPCKSDHCISRMTYHYVGYYELNGKKYLAYCCEVCQLTNLTDDEWRDMKKEVA